MLDVTHITEGKWLYKSAWSTTFSRANLHMVLRSESCHTYEWVTSHVAYVMHPYPRVTSHTFMSATHSLARKSTHTSTRITSHTWMSHVTHVNTHHGVSRANLYMIRRSSVTHMNGSRHTLHESRPPYARVTSRVLISTGVTSHTWMCHVTHVNTHLRFFNKKKCLTCSSARVT